MTRKLLNGLSRLLPVLAEPGVSSAMATWPIFSFTSYKMMSRVAALGLQPGTIIDVGANVGQFAVSASRFFPACVIHSYEPAPDVFAKLTKNAKSCPNLTVRQLALGSGSGQLEFHVNSHRHSSSALPLAEIHKNAFPEARETGTISVPVETLDTLYANQVLAGPVLLKLDVQGFESEVLRGGTTFLKRVDHILVEMSFQPMYVGEPTFHAMLNLLDGLGFILNQPVGFLNDPQSDRFLQMDGLFNRIAG